MKFSLTMLFIILCQKTQSNGKKNTINLKTIYSNAITAQSSVLQLHGKIEKVRIITMIKDKIQNMDMFCKD